MSSRESIFVLDDSSIESAVMQYELKTSYDTTVIRMPAFVDVDTWIKDFEYHLKDVIDKMTGIIKIFLPFSFEDYVTKDIRTAILEIQRKYPNIRIIPWYEQASKEGLKNRALNYGITANIYDKTLLNKDVAQKEEIKNIASDIVKKASETKIAEDVITPAPIGHEDLSNEFVDELKRAKGKKKRFAKY